MKSDITWHDSCLSVCFRRGKGALLRGTAYTVHTGPIPMSYASRLRSWMEARRTWLFPKEVKGHLLRNALRRADPALEQRSLRRGSLQLLASVTGITDETLLLFSGHSSVKTLRRYLNWGVKANHTRTTMANVGGMLMSAQQPPVNPQDGQHFKGEKHRQSPTLLHRVLPATTCPCTQNQLSQQLTWGSSGHFQCRSSTDTVCTKPCAGARTTRCTSGSLLGSRSR